MSTAAAFWQQPTATAASSNNNNYTAGAVFRGPGPQTASLAPNAYADASSHISVAAANPQLFLQGFRLRTCPTKPVPWELVRPLGDFTQLRMAPPDLDKMKELTLALVDAQFDANTLFGEVTVAVKGGGHIVKPVPSVGDVVGLARALQATLQFHLHSIQALRDQVRKQQTINSNFEHELRRITGEHVSVATALQRSRDTQVSALEDRVHKLAAENAKLREQLATSESRVKELQIENQSSLLAWKEERMKLTQENYTLRQFVAGFGGGGVAATLSSGPMTVDQMVASASAAHGGGKHDKNSKRDKHNSHRDDKHYHRDHRSHSSKHNNKCDEVSCYKCGRGAMRPIPIAFINPELHQQQQNQNQQQNQQQAQQQQQNKENLPNPSTLPVVPPSAMQQLRLQEVVDKNKAQTDEKLNGLQSLMQQQQTELRNSIQVVESVAHRSLQNASDAEARQRESNERITDALLELRKAQGEGEQRVLGVISGSEANMRKQMQEMGVSLQKETQAVGGQVSELHRRVANLEGDVDSLKQKQLLQQQQQQQQIQAPNAPVPVPIIAPQPQPQQPVEEPPQKIPSPIIAPKKAMSDDDAFVQEQPQHQQQSQPSPFAIQPKMVVLPLSRQHQHHGAAAAAAEGSTTETSSDLQQQHQQPKLTTVALLAVQHPAQAAAADQQQQQNAVKRRKHQRGPDDSETPSTTDSDDSLQAKRRERRAKRKQAEREAAALSTATAAPAAAAPRATGGHEPAPDPEDTPAVVNGGFGGSGGGAAGLRRSGGGFDTSDDDDANNNAVRRNHYNNDATPPPPPPGSPPAGVTSPLTTTAAAQQPRTESDLARIRRELQELMAQDED